MTINIGINGFGRMGRLALRAAWDRPEVNVLHINEIKGGPETAAHLLEYDTVHGKWEREVRSGDNELTIGRKKISFSNFNEPSNILWRKLGVDFVLECSGKFLSIDQLNPLLDNGA